MEAVKLQKSYGKKRVLRDISFAVQKGECIGFIGANGCGKSTLFRILAGVEKADGGELRTNERIGYIPQDNALMADLSVRDNLRLFAALSGMKKDKERMKALCEQFRITEFEKERVSRLSGGMKKRVSIVCALLGEPDILIMDEPSAALDLVFKEELKLYIRDFTKAGGSVLLSSHDRGEIMQCNRIFAIKDGVAREIPEGTSMEEIAGEYIR